jgi:preprotein translocase subunit SecG
MVLNTKLLKMVLTILFIIVSVVISVIILAQQGKDEGLGSLSGQTSDTYWSRNKGRSKEGILIKVTSALIVVYFVLAAVLNVGSF